MRAHKLCEERQANGGHVGELKPAVVELQVDLTIDDRRANFVRNNAFGLSGDGITENCQRVQNN